MTTNWIDELTAGELEMHLEEFGIVFPDDTPRDTLARSLKNAYERERRNDAACKERLRREALEAGFPRA